MHLPLYRCTLRRALAIAAAASSSACGGERATGSGPSDRIVPAPRVADVVVSPEAADLLPGQTTQLVALVRDSAGAVLSNRVVTWLSADTVVARVSAAGLVEARGAGETVVIAASDAAQDTVDVAVRPVPVAAVQIAAGLLTLVVGQRQQLTFAALDSAGAVLLGRTATWASSDPAVAAVSAGGEVTAHAAGGALVTATSEGRYGPVRVTVQPVPIATTRVTPDPVALIVGDEQRLSASVFDSAGQLLAGRLVTWTTSDSSVAVVSADGVVQARVPGSATVTAASGGQVGAASVTVRPAPVALVEITPGTDTVIVGEIRRFVATTRDAAGVRLTGRAVAWTSSNEAALTVSASGIAAARAAGGAVLTATSEGVRATAAIRVTRPTSSGDTVRIVTFGDSNTDFGYAGTNPARVVASYVSAQNTRLAAGAPNSALQLAGKIERRWRAMSAAPIRAVNHAIGGTTTGGGVHGGPDRTHLGAPQARMAVGGVTRFEGEVLATIPAWSGGEDGYGAFPNGAIRRVQAFRPSVNSFAYVSLGSNDPSFNMPAAETLANLAWMVER